MNQIRQNLMLRILNKQFENRKKKVFKKAFDTFKNNQRYISIRKRIIIGLLKTTFGKMATGFNKWKALPNYKG